MVEQTDTAIVIVLTTLDAGADAAAIASTLVSERLAACISVLPPMQSTYRWQGAVESAREHQLIVKTTRDRLELLEQRLAALHPYEVPEFLVIEAAHASAGYGGWLRDAVR